MGDQILNMTGKIDVHRRFLEERRIDVSHMARDENVIQLGRKFIIETLQYKYSYNFSWLGRPVIQLPEDLLAIQEVIWKVKPDLIIETGVAHGGSIIFYASLLELLGGNGEVLGIDIEIRQHNLEEIKRHPLFHRIALLEGSSVDHTLIQKVYDLAKPKNRVLVILDSDHRHEHVLKELELYSTLVLEGSYIIVLDTIIEDLPEGCFSDRPWDKGNNPKTAVWEFLENNHRFEVDQEINNKLVISSAPNGFLKCILPLI